MKLKDVLLKAMAKKITWWEAAEIIGVTDRTMRRLREPVGGARLLRLGGSAERESEFSTSAAEDLRRGAAALSREVLRLQHPALSREATKQASNRVELHVGAAGLARGWTVKRRSRCGPHRKRRERRPLPGMLLHTDASKHGKKEGRFHWLHSRRAQLHVSGFVRSAQTVECVKKLGSGGGK